jgi:OOP family OmpA-OmpF porin
MKKYYSKIIAVFFVSILLSTKMIAQESSTNDAVKLFNGTQNFSTWSIGLNVGGLMPMSAFGGRNDFSEWETNLGYGLYVKKQFSHVFGLQADFLGGKLSANNNRLWAGLPPPSPYKSFSTDLNWSASLSAVATLGNINWSQLNTSIKPYLSLGMGAVGYESTLTTVENVEVNGHPNGAVTTMFIPVGIGFKARMSPSINLDFGYKVGFVDADDLDGYYKEPIVNDRFSYGHIGLEFVINGKQKTQLARHNAPRQMSKEFADRDYALAEQIRLLNTSVTARDNEIKALKEEHDRMKKDTDADGVSDYFDKCPGTAMGTKVDGSGCAYVTVVEKTPEAPTKIDITDSDNTVVKEASSRLQFETGSAVIKTASFVYLNKVADILIKKNANIKLTGYTDNVGSEATNLKLSTNRANAVKNYLIKQGVAPEHISAMGYGEADPIATNKTAAGRAKNRRVEFSIY